MRRQIGPARSVPARTATAATAAPAPAPAPRSHVGGADPRNAADSGSMMSTAGRTKHAPPTSAPTVPRSRHAQ